MERTNENNSRISSPHMGRNGRIGEKMRIPEEKILSNLQASCVIPNAKNIVRLNLND
jgi:hypothetical protein